MGVKRLNKKVQLNYRCGTTSRSCQYCNHFYSGPLTSDFFRCKIIGLLAGRSYRINPNHICDQYDGSNYLKRLKAGTSFAE